MWHMAMGASSMLSRTLSVVLVWILIQVLPIAAQAQSSGGPFGTIGSLLEQLTDLQTSGALDQLGGKITSRLDEARKRGLDLAQGLQSGSPEVQQALEELRRRSGAFDEDERLLIQKYCADELSSEERRTVERIENFSRLERDYCRRTGEPLFQYGYGIFAGDSSVEALSIGAIDQDYVLGVGDELVVTFHGQDSRTFNVLVDREGRVVLPDFPPIPAAGRTFGELQREIEARTAATRLGTEVYVSLGAVRAVSVIVAGEVRNPGRHQLTGLSSIIDAISMAGGVKKTGSIRRIHIQRGDSIFWFDAYDVLFTGALPRELTLLDGDQIVVPSLGPTVAVTGDVMRPGIYELAEGQTRITIGELTALAGGTLRPRGNRFLHLEFDASGQERLRQRTDESATISDGEIVIVDRGKDIQLGTVEIVGHVRVPGRRSLASVPTLKDLIGDATTFKPDPYLLFAALETTDPATRARRLFPVNLERVMAGEQNYSLRDGDRLIVLSADDIRFLSSGDVQSIIAHQMQAEVSREDLTARERRDEAQPPVENDTAAALGGADRLSTLDRLLRAQQAAGATGVTDRSEAAAPAEPAQAAARPTPPTCAGLERLRAIVAATSASRFANAVRTIDPAEKLAQENRQECPEVFGRFGDLLPLALEHVVAVNGEVRRPGAYPVVGNTPVTSVIAVSGGLTREVDLTKVEVSRYAPDPRTGQVDTSRGLINLAKLGAENVAISAGDVVRFNPVFTDRDSGPVLLVGQFVRPGLYEIRRGETLSQVIARAGGLTQQAYPYGAVFTREAVRRLQEAGFKRASRELSSALAIAAVRRNVNPEAVLALQRMSSELESIEAMGRVVIEADPTVLQVRPELDVVLEPGDRVFMPKRPSFVSVIGDVLNPGALQFRSGVTADQYIRQAGGFQRSADEGRVFVVYPNGAAEPLRVSAWNFDPVQIPPGSLIVVPKDPLPFDLYTFAIEGADLLSKLAVTLASLVVISSN